MLPVARIGDAISTGHECTGTGIIDQGSTNVFVNGRGAVRVGDSDTHTEPIFLDIGFICVDHTVTVGSASTKVFVNGRGLARVGDTFSGELISTGSSNVFSG
jgi:uncharacterized Zn-binding protein involved in type VI secretion